LSSDGTLGFYYSGFFLIAQAGKRRIFAFFSSSAGEKSGNLPIKKFFPGIGCNSGANCGTIKIILVLL
jgi:hypothetical protein